MSSYTPTPAHTGHSKAFFITMCTHTRTRAQKHTKCSKTQVSFVTTPLGLCVLLLKKKHRFSSFHHPSLPFPSPSLPELCHEICIHIQYVGIQTESTHRSGGIACFLCQSHWQNLLLFSFQSPFYTSAALWIIHETR